jgi:uncharacterized membrane protein
MTKTITFGIMHMGIAFTVAYLLTGDIVVGGAVALVEPAVNTVAYYFHEKVWRRREQADAKRAVDNRTGATGLAAA